MSYLCGLQFPGLHRTPQIVCDGCGATFLLTKIPPAWFLDGRPPPRWTGRRATDATPRQDWCAACRTTREGK